MLWVVEHVVRRWKGGLLSGPRKTARQPAVTMNGNVLHGPVQLAVARLGSLQSALHDNRPRGVLTPLELKCPPLEVVCPTLECELCSGLPELPGVCFADLLPLLLLVLPLLVL